MDKEKLTQRIKEKALEIGFDLVGISPAHLPADIKNHFLSWVEKGFAGSMNYMEKAPSKRTRPEDILEGAKSVISLGVNYFNPDEPKPQTRRAGEVARYARGQDYHKVLEKKLKSLSKAIGEMTDASVKIKYYVDTGPILEKAFAQQAGLGFIGKNTLLISKEFGSWLFLSSLITTLDLVYDLPNQWTCGSCTLCLKACPTQAFKGPYELDARRCISYLTIESREPIPDDIKPLMGDWVFGCDICQDVCPYNNRRLKPTRHAEFNSDRGAGNWLDLEELTAIENDADFQKKFVLTPLKRAKRLGLIRNAKAIIDNSITSVTI